MNESIQEGNDAPANLIALGSAVRIADLEELKQQSAALLAIDEYRTIVCDGARVEQVDAAALQFLAALRRACMGSQRGFELRAPSEALRGAAELSGFGELLAAPATH